MNVTERNVITVVLTVIVIEITKNNPVLIVNVIAIKYCNRDLNCDRERNHYRVCIYIGESAREARQRSTSRRKN